MRWSRAAALAALVVALTVVAGAHAGGAGALPSLPEQAPIDTSDRAPGAGPTRDDPGAAMGPTAAAGQEMVGLFAVTAGACTSAAVPRGSWFRMVQPGGDPQSGPFVDNNDSPCANKSATTLEAGRDGGLRTGEHQPAPDPAWDSGGNGLADRIVKPQRFYGVGFAAATNRTDPQTATAVAPPSLFVDGGKLSGDLRAFGVAWNRQHFNQGAPKPDGSTPGQTARPSGTYDASTGAFVLEWSSQIQGGPFNGFTGVWHLEGTFRSSGASAAGGSSDGPSASASAAGGVGAAAAPSGATATGAPGSHPRTGASAPWAAALVAAAIVARRSALRVAAARRARP